MSTFEATLHQLPKPILNKLRAMIRRVRRLLLIRGTFATLAVALTCVLIIMAVDASFTLFSNAARWALSLSGLAITSIAAWWFLLRPLSRRFTLTQIARILEIRHPELQERISTAVELMASEDPDSIRGSEELIEAVVDSAVIDVEAVDPKTEFKGARASKFVAVTGVVLVLIALLFLIWPKQSWTLMARAIAPFLNIGNAYADTLVVDPGDIRVAVGETVTVKLTVQHKNLRKAEIRRSLSEDNETVERMTLVKTEEDDTRHFEITFPSVEDSFNYRVQAGAAVSEYFTVEAVPKPAVENLHLRYDFPAYTQQGPQEADSDNGEIKALAHSQVTVTANLNKPVTEAKLLINEAFEPAAAEIVGNQATWRFELKPGTQGVWKIALTDADEFTNTPPSYSILAVPDEKPRIAIVSPEVRELRLKPSELLPIKYQVAEDYGFSQVDLLVTPNGEQNPIELLQPTPESNGQAGVWRGAAPLNLASLDLENHHNRLTVQLRARDNMPSEYEGPNVGLSETITIILDRGAKSLAEQTMEAQKKEIKEAIDEAQKELNEAKNEAKEAEKQLAREDTVSQDTMQDLEEFRENANTAQETLREVAERLNDTVFDKQAEQLEQVADEEVAQAREAADMIPVTDKKEERVAEAREAREQIEQALKDLDEIEKSLQESNEAMEMVADLNDLANEQRELAQQAEQNAEQQKQQTPEQNEQQAQQQQQQMQQFQQKQQQVQKELGEMLKENPEALREILEQQQKTAEQLAEQAEQMAQQQEQVREMTQNAAQEDQQQALQDQLVAQLQKMQEQVAQETQELQNQLNEQQQNAGQPLKEAAKQTQEASEKLQQENLADASETAKEAAEALAQAQEQSEAMAEQQAENAEQMQAQAEGQPEGQPQTPENQNAEGQPQSPEAQTPEMAQNQPASAPQPGQPEPAEGQTPESAQAQTPPAPQPGEPAGAEPQPGEPAPADPAMAEAQPQPGEPAASEPAAGEPQNGEPQAGASGEPQMAEAQQGEPQNGEPQPGQPQNPLAAEATQAQLAQLAETQEMIAQQLGAIEAGQLDDALAMMEEQLAEQSESLQAQAEALEQATQAAGQQNAANQANQAENQLKAAMTQTQQAQQQLTQAQQAQDAAEQQGQPASQTAPQAQQALKQSQGPQNQAEKSLNQAAQSLQQTAQALGQAMEGLDPGQQEEQMLDGQDLAESFEEVTESAESQNAQEAAEQSQQAAQSLQQLAQSAMEQLGQPGQPQDQPGQQGQQPPQPGEFVDGSQELNESGKKNADINGDGVPPELQALGISAEDWSRLKGTLQSGSASQGGDGLPAEYRDLVSRYFQVIAKEAGKKE